MGNSKEQKTKCKSKCHACGVESGKLEEFDHKKWCPACLERKTLICGKCGVRFYRDELIAFDDRDWCEDCLYEETAICADCGDRIYVDDARYVGDDPICERCYDDNYFQCEGCENHYHNDEYGGDGYCRHCAADNKPTVCPDNSRYMAKSRRDLPVGIEIEAEGGDYRDVYHELADDGFGVQGDASLDEDGIEIQVPASNGGNTERLVTQACESLADSGFYITKRCGLHVHIEYPSRMKTIKRLMLMVYACEPVLYAVNPASRRDNNFCQPLNRAFSVHEIIRTQARDMDRLFYSKKHPDLTETKVRNFKRFKWNECRYFGFNLHSLFYRGTVEFRYHSGTISPDKIIRWVDLLKAILLYVRFSYNQDEVFRIIEQPGVLGKIRQMRNLLGLDEPLVDYFVNRYIKFVNEYVRHN